MANTQIQLRFSEPDFVPIPNDLKHYVPVLQNRSGELRALRELSKETWDNITPILEIVGPKNRPDCYKLARVNNWVKKIAEVVGKRTFYLDVLRLNYNTPTDTQIPVLEAIFEIAHKKCLSVVPVFSPDKALNSTYLKILNNAISREGRGIGIRYPILSAVPRPGSTRRMFLERALASLDISEEHVDVFIDMSFISSDSNLSLKHLVTAIDEICSAGKWRCIALLGSSIPSVLSEIPEGTVGALKRQEWRIWSEITQNQSIRKIIFGDYVIQNPIPPMEEGGPGMRANIRYTVDDCTLIARGSGPVIETGKEQYIDLCEQLMQRPEFAGQDFSWGDSVISACARLELDPGSQNQWRAAGSSHHIQFVAHQLKALKEPLPS